MSSCGFIRSDRDRRPAKKLRTGDPDCKIILRWETSHAHGGEDPVHHEKEYKYHSIILANLSTVVDETFEINNNKDGNDMEIVFEGVTPRTFEKAMKYLEDPAETRKVEWFRIKGVLPFYHKYDFSGGLNLCDQVMGDYFSDRICKIYNNNTDFLSDQFDDMIDQVVMVEKYNLERALSFGLKFCQGMLGSKNFPYGCTMFTEGHAKLLQPLFVKGSLKCPGITKQKELESEVFPKLMVMSLRDFYMSEKFPGLTVSGASDEVDGEYRYNTTSKAYERADDHTGYFDGEEVKYFICKADSQFDWTIVARARDGDGNWTRVECLLWWCSHSHNLPLPPTGSWMDDDSNTNKIQFKYSGMVF